jgi:hydroxymethylpyrimidine/phosphomethylpyrimidine kinase
MFVQPASHFPNGRRHFGVAGWQHLTAPHERRNAILAITLYLWWRYLGVPIVLTIAGSDSIGGAGIQADLKAIASLGMHGASAITAVTAQNTKGVRRVAPLEADAVVEQIEAVFDDADVGAVKVGMLFSPEVAVRVADALMGRGVPIVVDPVLFAGAGDSLHREGLLEALRSKLVPMATVVTPNRGEAEALSSGTVLDVAGAEAAGRALLEIGALGALVKGGHMEMADVVDVFCEGGDVLELRSPRLAQKVHGGGCTLSSYIAAFMARGMAGREAVLAAKLRIHDAIALSYRVGGGMNAVNPMATLQKRAMEMDAVERVRKACELLEGRLDPEWLPRGGGNLAYSLPYPVGISEVCAIDGGIQANGGRAKRIGDVRFSASEECARVILDSIGCGRSAACLKLDGSDERLDILRGHRLRISDDRTLAGQADVVLREEGGKNAAYLLGLDPEDVVARAHFLLKGLPP